MKRRDEVLVGMVATVSLVMGFLGALWLARGGLMPGYPLYSKFAWGAGLKQGQPVLLAGVSVGYVDKVALMPEGHLVVTLRVRHEYQVPKGTTATVAPNGFFGDMLIALKPSKPTTETFAEGDTIPQGVGSPAIGDVLVRMDSLAADLSIITRSLRRELVDDHGLRDIRATIAKANGVFESVQKLATEQNEELKRTQAALRKMTTAVDSAQVDSTLKSMKAAAASFTALSTDLKSTTTRLDSLMAKVNNGPGTVGKLMNDPALYGDVRGTLQRLDSLMADLMKNPKKYVKLSIF
jgi:phospholipid/cholesterol/gamma-HCH transport system substrate-binding protein